MMAGFCLSTMTLRPSAFYGAAGLRTAAIRSAIWRSVRAPNASEAYTPAVPGARRCVQPGGHGGSRRPGAPPGLDACQLEVCGIEDCNLVQ